MGRIWFVVGVGVATFIAEEILSAAGKEKIAKFVGLAVIVLILSSILAMVSELFLEVERVMWRWMP